MATTTSQRLRNLLIAVAVVILSVGLFIGNTIRTRSVSLEALAAQSVALEEARTNGRPTLMEFYADWCTTCQAMAPMMATLETEYSDAINFVMLNVDNPKWLPELGQFQVSGIPHFVFLDQGGTPLAYAIGDQPEAIMKRNLVALAAGELLVEQADGQVSDIPSDLPVRDQPDPRSHG